MLYVHIRIAWPRLVYHTLITVPAPNTLISLSTAIALRVQTCSSKGLNISLSSDIKVGSYTLTTAFQPKQLTWYLVIFVNIPYILMYSRNPEVALHQQVREVAKFTCATKSNNC